MTLSSEVRENKTNMTAKEQIQAAYDNAFVE